MTLCSSPGKNDHSFIYSAIYSRESWSSFSDHFQKSIEQSHYPFHRIQISISFFQLTQSHGQPTWWWSTALLLMWEFEILVMAVTWERPNHQIFQALYIAPFIVQVRWWRLQVVLHTQDWIQWMGSCRLSGFVESHVSHNETHGRW